MTLDWSADHLVSLLSLGVIIGVGLLPSRHQPESRLFARQRWRYPDIVIVFSLITAVALVPAHVLRTMTLPIWVVEGVGTLVITVSIWGIVRWRHCRTLSALGLHTSTASHDALWSLRIGLGIISALIVFVVMVRSLDPQNWHAPGRAVWHGQVGDFIAGAIVTALFVPVAEELFFRGLAYGPLLRRLGPVGATIASAAIWASGHYSGFSPQSLFGVLFTLILGICYAEVYRRRESLVPALVFHVLQNTTAIFIGDRYLVTLIPLAGVAMGLWVVSAALFHVHCSRVRAD